MYAVRQSGRYAHWPAALVGATSVIRGEHLAAMKAADAGDMAPLVTLHERYAADITPPSS